MWIYNDVWNEYINIFMKRVKKIYDYAVKMVNKKDKTERDNNM